MSNQSMQLDSSLSAAASVEHKRLRMVLQFNHKLAVLQVRLCAWLHILNKHYSHTA